MVRLDGWIADANGPRKFSLIAGAGVVCRRLTCPECRTIWAEWHMAGAPLLSRAALCIAHSPTRDYPVPGSILVWDPLTGEWDEELLLALSPQLLLRELIIHFNFLEPSP